MVAQVYIKIDLQDVKESSIDVTAEGQFKFAGKVGGKAYASDVKLFAALDVKVRLVHDTRLDDAHHEKKKTRIFLSFSFSLFLSLSLSFSLSLSLSHSPIDHRRANGLFVRDRWILC